MHAQKSHRSLAHPFRGELRRHPHFFLVLFSFVFLGAMSAFLLVLSHVTTYQPQDLRQKASEIATSVTVNFTSQMVWPVNQPGSIIVTAQSNNPTDAIELDFIVSGTRQTLASLAVVVNENSGFNRELFIVTSDGTDTRVQVTLLSNSPSSGTQIGASGVELLRLNLTPASADDISITADNTASTAYVVGRTDDQLGAIANPVTFRVAPPVDTANNTPPSCSTHSDRPASGTAPLTVSLHGSGEKGSGVGLKGFRWDFDGNGTWDAPVGSSAISLDPVSYTYSTAGTYQPKFQVQNFNGFYSPVCPYPFPVVVTAATADSGVDADNLFFTNDSKLEFYKESNNESVKISDILSGERYKIRHTARVQNDRKKNNSTDNRSVTLQFQANDSAVSRKNFSMNQLHKAASGIDIVFETAFVGKTDNSFKTILDVANTVSETNENDNTLLTTYKYEIVTSTVNQATIASVCNSGCANDSDCSFGLKCWNNKCRHPDNVESDRCASRESAVAGCNIRCQSNRDCAAGLACSGNVCRNPQSPSNDRCQITTATIITQKKGEKTTTSGQKGSTLGPATAKPKSATATGSLKTPTPTVAPSTPEPTPEATVVPATPEPTVSSDVLGWFGQFPIFIQNFFSVQTQSGSGFPWLWLIVGGGILLLIILLMSLLGGRRKNRSLPEVPPPSTADPTLFSRGPVAAKTAGSSTGATVVATTARTVPNPVSPAGMNASAGSTAPAAILATGVRPQSPGTTTSAPSLIPQPTNPNQSSPALFAVPRPVAPQPNTATTQVAPVAQVMPARPTVAQGQPIAQPPSASPVISAPAPSTPAPTSRTLASSALVSPTPAHTSTSAPTSPTPAPQPLPTPARPLVASTTPLATPTPPSAQTPTQSQNSSMLSRLQARGVIKPSGSTAITNASTSGAIFPPAPTT